MQAPDAQCASSVLEHYAQRKMFTLRLMEERERQQFVDALSFDERRRAFTEQLMRQRAELAENDRKQFEDQVARYARLHEFTLRLQDERDTREALEFARTLALQEKKRAFTQRLIESRRAKPTNSPGNVPAPSIAPAQTRGNLATESASSQEPSPAHSD